MLAVTAGGPAAEAGILVGDIVLALDGEPLESPEELLDLLQIKGAGHHAGLRVLRASSIAEIAVTIGQRQQR